MFELFKQQTLHQHAFVLYFYYAFVMRITVPEEFAFKRTAEIKK